MHTVVPMSYADAAVFNVYFRRMKYFVAFLLCCDCGGICETKATYLALECVIRCRYRNSIFDCWQRIATMCKQSCFISAIFHWHPSSQWPNNNNGISSSQFHSFFLCCWVHIANHLHSSKISIHFDVHRHTKCLVTGPLHSLHWLDRMLLEIQLINLPLALFRLLCRNEKKTEGERVIQTVGLSVCPTDRPSIRRW